MQAEFWTTSGSDIWRVKERRVFDFKNLETGEVVTSDNVTEIMEKKFQPVTMPQIKKRKASTRQSTKASKSSGPGRRAKSKYKGVSDSKTPGKFRVQFYDKELKKNIGLGTFDSELLAAAAYQERAGNKKEAKRLRNEYEEGDCRPEVTEPKDVHKRMFEEDVPITSGPGEYSSED